MAIKEEARKENKRDEPDWYGICGYDTDVTCYSSEHTSAKYKIKRKL